MLSTGLGLAVLRVTLCVIFLMHGYLAIAVIGPAGVGGYTTRMGYPAALGEALGWYLIVAHGLGAARRVPACRGGGAGAAGDRGARPPGGAPVAQPAHRTCNASGVTPTMTRRAR